MMRRLLPYIGTGLLSVLATSLLLKAANIEPTANVLSANANQSELDGMEQRDRAPTELQLPQPRADVYYNAITDRPLFATNRRPFVEDAPAKEAPIAFTTTPVIEPRADVVLMGAMGRGDGMMALLKINDGKADWFAQGAQVQGWTVNKIEPTWVELTDGNTQLRLEMFK